MRFSQIRRFSGPFPSAVLSRIPAARFGMMYRMAFAPTQVTHTSASAVTRAAASRSFPFTARTGETVFLTASRFETISRGYSPLAFSASTRGEETSR